MIMVDVAQSVEHLTVDQVVVGSNPIIHPIFLLKIESGMRSADFFGVNSVRSSIWIER